MKKEKIHKNRLFTKYPDQTLHTVETMDKIVFSLCKLFTWSFPMADVLNILLEICRKNRPTGYLRYELAVAQYFH